MVAGKIHVVQLAACDRRVHAYPQESAAMTAADFYLGVRLPSRDLFFLMFSTGHRLGLLIST